MSVQAMDFAGFQATRRECANVAAEVDGWSDFGAIRGYVYLFDEHTHTGLVIERADLNAGYVLTIGNRITESQDLRELEYDLFAYAVSEGWIEEVRS